MMVNLEKDSIRPLPDHIKLFIPGPSEVKEDILAAQGQWMIGHRQPECADLIGRIEKKLQDIFSTRRRVLINTASGTGLQEAAVRNCSDVRVLNCVNGAFSDRWRHVTESNGKKNSVLEVEWGLPIEPEGVIQRLVGDEFDAITLVHNETSTGVISPIEEIASAVRSVKGNEIQILVDSVSGLGGAMLEFDSWDLDVVLTSSQKAFALPPGLSFCAVSDRAMAKARTVNNRGTYFDFIELDKYLQRNQTPATPAISLLFALDRQLDCMLAEGMENRCSRHTRLRNKTIGWSRSRGFSLFAAAGTESPTVTCLNNDRNIDIVQLNHYLGQRGFIISNGYGPLKDKTFRIAHMGETSEDDLEQLFEAIDDYLTATK